MKKLKYNFCTRVNRGTKDAPQWEEIMSPVEMGWNEINEAIAKREAYNGEYTIEDDGIEEIIVPTQLDRIESQIAYLAMMTGNTDILEV